MTLLARPSGMVRHLARRPALQAVARVRAAPVAKVQVMIEHLLQSPDAGEEAPAKLHLPQSWRIVPWSRSTKAFVQASRGLVRMCGRPSSRQTHSNGPRYSGP